MPKRLATSEYLAYLRPFYPDWNPDLEASIRRPPARRIGHRTHGMV